MNTYLNYTTAWRKWTILFDRKDDTFWLASIFKYFLWERKKVTRAECWSSCRKDGVIQMSCSCGIYGVKYPDEKITNTISGEVALWGKMIEHQLGYRATYAYPLSFKQVCCSVCVNHFWPEGTRAMIYTPRAPQIFSVYLYCIPCSTKFKSNIGTQAPSFIEGKLAGLEEVTTTELIKTLSKSYLE